MQPRSPCQRVLDVGCGGGFTCEFLAHQQAQVWGIDQDGFNLFGSTVGEIVDAYRLYQATGKFDVRFDDDLRIMYIGTAVKGEGVG